MRGAADGDSGWLRRCCERLRESALLVATCVRLFDYLRCLWFGQLGDFGITKTLENTAAMASTTIGTP
jgi:hypothetical protein